MIKEGGRVKNYHSSHLMISSDDRNRHSKEASDLPFASGRIKLHVWHSDTDLRGCLSRPRALKTQNRLASSVEQAT